MKKVLCVITSMGPGGAERQICGLAEMLARSGCEVRLRWFDGKPFYTDELDAAGVDYGRLGAYTRLGRAWLLNLSVGVHKPDTVVAFLSGAAEAACSLKRLGAGFRLVVSERNVTQDLSGEKRKFAAYRYADAVVCNSYTQAGLVREQFPDLAPKVGVITNFTDLEKFSPALAGTQKGAPLRICVVARTAAQKNVSRFVEAAGKAVAAGVEAEFDWYGASAPWLGSGRPAACSDGPSSSAATVRFHPPVTDVLQVYHSADALCLPSLYEGFPNAVCEAISCGQPVLCSNVCDNPRLVEDGVNGFLFDPLDAGSIASALKRFSVLTPEERAQMGAASRRKAETLLSPETFLAAWQEQI